MLALRRSGYQQDHRQAAVDIRSPRCELLAAWSMAVTRAGAWPVEVVCDHLTLVRLRGRFASAYRFRFEWHCRTCVLYDRAEAILRLRAFGNGIMGQNKNYRPKVPAPIKHALIEECGDKCANPGCPQTLLEFHHIEQWAVYQTHNEKIMIALCPTCHASVERGGLTISDDELYRWKSIKRSSGTYTGMLYVEPGPMPRVMLGNLAFTGSNGAAILRFENTKLTLTVHEQDLAILDLETIDSTGEPLVGVSHNIVRQRKPSVIINQHPGRFQVPTCSATDVLPQWALECLSKVPHPDNDPTQIDTLDVHVLEPGVVRVKGVFLGDTGGIVIDDHRILLLSRANKIVIGWRVEGNGGATLHDFGPIDQMDQSVFGRLVPPGFW